MARQEPATPGTPATGGVTLMRKWDTDTAAAALVVGSLVFLFLVRRGFSGLVIGAS